MYKISEKLKAIAPLLMRPNLRAVLWILLLILTAAILLSPVSLAPEYRPIQSLYIFDNLPLVTVLYCFWISLILALLFSLRKEERVAWQKLALVLVFAVVFTGFWASLNHGYSREASGFAALIETLGREGGIPQPPYGYFNFPGLVILTSTICQITGLPTFDVIFLLIMFQILLFATLVFILFRNFLMSTLLASLGILLMIQGDIMITKLLSQFHAGAFVILYFILFLVVISRHERTLIGSWKDILLLTILVSAATITHFVTSYVFVLVLSGIFLVQMAGKRKEALLTVPIIVLCVVIPLVWGNVHAGEVSESVYQLVPEATERLPEAVSPEAITPEAATPEVSTLEEKLLSGYTLGLARAHFGSAVPLWARVTKIFWIALVVLLSSILGFWGLFRVKSSSFTEKRKIGGFVGVVLLGIITLLLARGEEAFRFLIYIPFFTVPFLISFFFSPERRAQKFLLVLFIALFLVSSFPTFLAHNDTIAGDTYYPSELAGGSFLRSNYGYGEGLHLFSYTRVPVDYFVPNASLTKLWLQDTSVRNTEEDYWDRLNELITRFENANRGSVFFVQEERIRFSFQHLLNIDPETRLEWKELKARLSQESLIYNGGYVQCFVKN